MGFMARKLAFIVAIIVAVVCIAPAAAVGAQARRVARCTVPRLSGDSLATARKRLDHAGCRVGRVHRPKTASGSLVVRRQSVRPGRRLRHGARVALWLHVKPAKTNTPTSGITLPTTTTATVSAPTVRASIDPTFVQDPNDPLHVTWTYDAGVDNGTLPDGTLSLTIYQHGQVAAAGGCTINVGGTVTGGTCAVELPQYGEYDVTVTYTSSTSTVAPSTQTETDTISAPVVTPPAPIATTASLTITESPVTTGTGPPPMNTPYADSGDAVVLTTNDPENVAYTITVADVTTGQTFVGTQQLDQSTMPPCGFEFMYPAYQGNVALYGCGIGSLADPIVVAPTDELQISVAITGSNDGTNDYLPSSSSPVTLPDPLAAY